MAVGVASMYEGWQRIQAHLVHRLPQLGPDELQLKASTDGWPIWAMVAHLAGGRVYWLCGIFNEPGAETTPFKTPFDKRWESDLATPRGSDELMWAVESSWRIAVSCLERWTPEMLGETVTRTDGATVRRHSRASVLTRLATHDAFHCGEVSLVLGMHGLPSMDPWEPIV